MSKIVEKVFNKYVVRLYLESNEICPLIIVPTYEDNGKELIEGIKNVFKGDFNICVISNINWDHDLSPWACGPIVYKNDHFDGGADSFVEFIKTSILTFCYQNIAAKSDYLIIAGYSLAGLFSIYSAFKISTFDAIVSASGSLWFPKFMEYVKSNVFIKKPTFIYLSIGDKESNTKNEYLKTTVSNTQELQIYFNNLGIKSIFELNPGNHFQDANFRLAKGIGIALNFYSSKK